MKKDQNLLIEELLDLTEKKIVSIQKFKDLAFEELNYKSSADVWSALECLEHLNLYGDFYLPEIESQILKAKRIDEKLLFKSGIIGNYFVNIIKAESNKKMKATKEMDSTNSKLSLITIDRFVKQLEQLKSLLIECKQVDLTKVKTSISLTKLIKLRLGDTLRFLVHHNERHILQAQLILQKSKL